MIEKPKVVIDNEVFRKIMHWVNKSSYEVSGLGTVVVEPNGVLRVTEAMLLPQKNTSTHTDIEPEDVGKLMFQMKDAQGDLRFWWHSHVDMGVFWSGTDMDTIKKVGQGGWFLSTVFNKKRECRSAYYAVEGCTTPWGKQALFLDELPTSVTTATSDEEAQWDVEYETNVTNLTYAASRTGAGYPAYGHWDNEHGWTHNRGYPRVVDGNVKPPEPVKEWSADELKQAVMAESAKDRPAGMTKRQWKQIRKQAKAAGMINQKDVELDDYGFDQEDRQFFSQMGWDESDFDDLSELDVTPSEMLLLASYDAMPGEIISCIQSGWEMKDLLGHYQAVSDRQLCPMGEDDGPVMDRANGGKYDA